MGNFKIEINAVGGHGDDRTAEAGQPITLVTSDSAAQHQSPDRLAYDFVQSLKAKSMFQAGGTAEMTHWPGEKSEVVDDLLNGIRLAGSFHNPKEDEDSILQYFACNHLPASLAAISRPFAEAARRIVRTIPRNAERTVALRKLLESKDAAVRAAITK